MTEDEKWAWLAGFLEGEGCWSLHKVKRFVGIRISVGNTDHDSILRCAEITGVGTVTGPYNQQGNRKPMFYWKVSGSSALVITERIYFMMGRRRHTLKL